MADPRYKSWPSPLGRRFKSRCPHCGPLPGQFNNREQAIEQHDTHMATKHSGRVAAAIEKAVS